jgi:hypothetical protein
LRYSQDGHFIGDTGFSPLIEHITVLCVSCELFLSIADLLWEIHPLS